MLYWAKSFNDSLFYNKVLSISCNLLNTALKVENKMVLSIFGYFPCDHVAG